MHIINHRFIGLLLASTLIAGTIFAPGSQAVPVIHAAQAGAPQVRPDAAARVDTYFTQLLQAHRFSGAVLLAQGTTILLSKGYGMANWSRQIHNTASTEFPDPVTALEKFAAAAVLQLEDAGKLHEGDHICAYIPHCPVTWAPITVHELLTFTSGIRDYGNKPTAGFSQSQSFTLEGLVTWLGTLPLDYKPGMSCCSFIPSPPVEEYLVERMTGEPFATYLQSHFLSPLGLVHTGYFLHQPPKSLPVVGYQSWQVPGSYDASVFGGVVYTTVTDFYHWLYALLTGQVLSPMATTRLLTPSFTVCPPQCLGLTQYSTLATSDGYVVGAEHGVHVLLHWNDSYFADKISYYPAAKISLIILANLGDPQWIVSSQEPLIFS